MAVCALSSPFLTAMTRTTSSTGGAITPERRRGKIGRTSNVAQPPMQWLLIGRRALAPAHHLVRARRLPLLTLTAFQARYSQSNQLLTVPKPITSFTGATSLGMMRRGSHVRRLKQITPIAPFRHSGPSVPAVSQTLLVVLSVSAGALPVQWGSLATAAAVLDAEVADGAAVSAATGAGPPANLLFYFILFLFLFSFNHL
jgi:hypothetical protein